MALPFVMIMSYSQVECGEYIQDFIEELNQKKMFQIEIEIKEIEFDFFSFRLLE